MHICGTWSDRRNYAIPEGLLELLHGGLQLELVTEFGRVGEVVGVVFSLTQLDSIKLVVSSLTDWYTSESGVN